jgi:hypothetical protein
MDTEEEGEGAPEDGADDDSNSAPLPRFGVRCCGRSPPSEQGEPLFSPPPSLWLFQGHSVDSNSHGAVPTGRRFISREIGAAREEVGRDGEDRGGRLAPRLPATRLFLRAASSTLSSQSFLSTRTNPSCDGSCRSLPEEEESEAEAEGEAEVSQPQLQHPPPSPTAVVAIGGGGGPIVPWGSAFDGEQRELVGENDATLDTLTESVRSWSLVRVREGQLRRHLDPSAAREARRRVVRALLQSRSSSPSLSASSCSPPSSSPPPPPSSSRGEGDSVAVTLLPSASGSRSVAGEGPSTSALSSAASHCSASSLFSIASSANGETMLEG